METIGKTVEDRIILTDVSSITKMAGSIHIPDSVDLVKRGTVYRVGPAVKQYVEGDQVVFERGAGLEVALREEKYVVVREGNILFGLENE